MSNNKKRCSWCNEKNPLYVEYHDKEWGVRCFSDEYLFEMLLLESFQAGLSWECVLNKRESFRTAYMGFDYRAIALFGDEKIEELMSTPGIIRSRRKIAASIKNAQVFLSIIEEFGSFYGYLCGFTNGECFTEVGKAKSELSERISRDLSARGMTFVGSVIIYSFLQAVGIVYSHERECFLYK